MCEVEPDRNRTAGRPQSLVCNLDPRRGASRMTDASARGKAGIQQAGRVLERTRRGRCGWRRWTAGSWMDPAARSGDRARRSRGASLGWPVVGGQRPGVDVGRAGPERVPRPRRHVAALCRVPVGADRGDDLNTASRSGCGLGGVTLVRPRMSGCPRLRTGCRAPSKPAPEIVNGWTSSSTAASAARSPGLSMIVRMRRQADQLEPGRERHRPPADDASSPPGSFGMGEAWWPPSPGRGANSQPGEGESGMATQSCVSSVWSAADACGKQKNGIAWKPAAFRCPLRCRRSVAGRRPRWARRGADFSVVAARPSARGRSAWRSLVQSGDGTLTKHGCEGLDPPIDESIERERSICRSQQCGDPERGPEGGGAPRAGAGRAAGHVGWPGISAALVAGRGEGQLLVVVLRGGLSPGRGGTWAGVLRRSAGHGIGADLAQDRACPPRSAASRNRSGT